MFLENKNTDGDVVFSVDEMWLEYLLFLKKLSVKARNKAVEDKSSRVLKEHFSAVKEVGVQTLYNN